MFDIQWTTIKNVTIIQKKKKNYNFANDFIRLKFICIAYLVLIKLLSTSMWINSISRLREHTILVWEPFRRYPYYRWWKIIYFIQKYFTFNKNETKLPHHIENTYACNANN